MDNIVERASGSVEILRGILHSMTRWLNSRDPHRRKTEVDPHGDILTLCSSLKTSRIHELVSPRHVPAAKTKVKKKKNQSPPSGVKDVMELGRQKTGSGGGFTRWMKNSLRGYDRNIILDDAENRGEGDLCNGGNGEDGSPEHAGDEGEESSDEEYECSTGFEAPEGQFDIEWGCSEDVPNGLADSEDVQDEDEDYIDGVYDTDVQVMDVYE
jgi:hypothetical protein